MMKQCLIQGHTPKKLLTLQHLEVACVTLFKFVTVFLAKARKQLISILHKWKIYKLRNCRKLFTKM